MGAINVAHDSRVSRLDSKEDELRQAEQRTCNNIVQQVAPSSYHPTKIKVSHF